MKLSIIVAAAKNHAIGKDNRMLWHLPADFKYFKFMTSTHHIIMGRKTFDSIGKPLPNRTSVVITRNPDFSYDGVIVVNSLEKAIEVAKKRGDDEAFVIGGGQIYKEALPLADVVYLTEVKTEVDGDTFFPELGNEWKEESREPLTADEKHAFAFDFVKYVRSN